MWETLRSLKHPGLHFRRQGKVGAFTVDFVCRRARLVIEVDGGVHRIKQDADAVRNRVLQAIAEAGFPPPPSPPRRGGGE